MLLLSLLYSPCGFVPPFLSVQIFRFPENHLPLLSSCQRQAGLAYFTQVFNKPAHSAEFEAKLETNNFCLRSKCPPVASAVRLFASLPG